MVPDTLYWIYGPGVGGVPKRSGKSTISEIMNGTALNFPVLVNLFPVN